MAMPTHVLARLDARDRALYVRLTRAPYPATAWHRGWAVLSWAGSAWGVIGVCGVSLLFPAVSVRLAGHALLVLGVSHVVVQIIKHGAGRERPGIRLAIEPVIAVPDRFSFPSGHACAAMAIAAVYALGVPSVSVPALTLATLIGFSRVALGVHYPGDVLMGQVIALLTTLAVALVS